MSDSTEMTAFVCGTIALGCMLMFVGAICGHGCANDRMQREAIEHNAAEYDSKTGEWKWKESP